MDALKEIKLRLGAHATGLDVTIALAIILSCVNHHVPWGVWVWMGMGALLCLSI